MKPSYFATPSDFRAWLKDHHASAGDLWVGFFKRGSGKPSITWPEAVDVALCYGWIDGVRRSVDDDRYAIRFTPRRPGSVWSVRNVDRAEELTRQRLMRAPGKAAFEQRVKENSGAYSYEQRRSVKLDRSYERQLRNNSGAWSFFQGQPHSYRRAAIWWVMSAIKEETRLRRLATLILDSENGRTIKPLTRKKRS